MSGLIITAKSFNCFLQHLCLMIGIFSYTGWKVCFPLFMLNFKVWALPNCRSSYLVQTFSVFPTPVYNCPFSASYTYLPCLFVSEHINKKCLSSSVTDSRLCFWAWIGHLHCSGLKISPLLSWHRCTSLMKETESLHDILHLFTAHSLSLPILVLSISIPCTVSITHP